jgi:hypothetical protein
MPSKKQRAKEKKMKKKAGMAAAATMGTTEKTLPAEVLGPPGRILSEKEAVLLAPPDRPNYVCSRSFLPTDTKERQTIHFFAKTKQLEYEDVTKCFADIGYNRDGTPISEAYKHPWLLGEETSNLQKMLAGDALPPQPKSTAAGSKANHHTAAPATAIALSQEEACRLAPPDRPNYVCSRLFVPTDTKKPQVIHFFARTKTLEYEDVTKCFADVGYNRDGTPLK